MNARTSLLAAAACACAAVCAAPRDVYEVWDVPPSGLLRLAVPADLPGDGGGLAVSLDGARVVSQEIADAGECVVRVPAPLVEKAKTASLRVAMERTGAAAPRPTPVSRLVVSNAAFSVAFDEAVGGGWPSRLAWASGKTCERLTWFDRIYTSDNSQGMGGQWGLRTARKGSVLDFGRGPVFRQVRTVAEFAGADGRVCPARPRAVYDWVFFDDAAEWTLVRMAFAEESPATWEQLQAGIPEFPFGAFTVYAADGGRTPLVGGFPADGAASLRRVGRAWSAFHDGRRFAAVYSSDNCCFMDVGRRVGYLHASNRVSYSSPWSGSPVARTAFFRFGESDAPERALAAEPPVRSAGGLRRLDVLAGVDAVRPGETMAEWTAGGIDVRVGVRDGRRAEIRSVRVGGRLVAVGPQPLFSVVVEEVKTGRRTEISSSDEWAAVAVASDAANGAEMAWTFTAPAKNAAWTNLSVTVAARPGADGAGLDWSFAGATGSDGFALCEATVGALEFLSTGSAMRALYPGSMGAVAMNPCADACSFRGNYSSMHCVMPWEAVWDEASGRGFYVGAHDPKGGAKTVALTGSSARAAVRLAVTHRLSWDGARPGAKGAMSGTIHWRPLRGDWYEAACVYRDFVRERAAWYPKMGPEGRVSTPMWFKRLGYVVRTYGLAEQAERDVKTCMDYLGVPVMAHWYHWHRIPFDNDYPHYFPAKPGFEEGVKRIQAMGAFAVPYTNGHIWDMRDRGAEDWQFSSVGAKGACMKRDGTFYEERYRSVETNGERVVFAPMCPASQVWHDKVVENCDKVVNAAGLNGYYMDQVGAFATIDCRNPAHGHPFGGGSWWQEGYRRLLADARAKCGGKDVFFATEGNGEHTFDQVDAFVCWQIEGGVDTVPAFEVCYSGAVNVYCRSYVGAKGNGWRQMRMKFANVVADGHLMGWMPADYCREPKLNAYLRECVRFRHHNAEWFYKGEMRRVPKLLDAVPEWDEAWDIFGRQRPTRMPIVQAASRALLDYDYAPDGRRLWKTGRVRKAVVYFTNFSDCETATARVGIDWDDLGVDPRQASFAKVDAEGRRTPFSFAELSAPIAFAPGVCFGIEITPSPAAAAENTTHARAEGK